MKYMTMHVRSELVLCPMPPLSIVTNTFPPSESVSCTVHLRMPATVPRDTIILLYTSKYHLRTVHGAPPKEQ